MPKLEKKVKIWGTNLSDLIIGSDDDEIIRGRCGNDEMYGARGDDRMNGGWGNDFLSGGQGQDRLHGGKGADTFCFDGDFDQDIVRDFDACEGDSFKFIFYEPEQADWTGDDLLDMCIQRGKNVILDLPGSDEKVTLRKTDLRDLNADMFDVQFIPDPGLVA